MNIYLVILVAGLVIGGVGAGLISLTHYFDRKEDRAKAEWIREELLPATKDLMLEMMDECVDRVMEKMVEMTKKMMNDNYFNNEDE